MQVILPARNAKLSARSDLVNVCRFISAYIHIYIIVYICVYVCPAKWWPEKQIHLNRELCVCFACAAL